MIEIPTFCTIDEIRKHIDTEEKANNFLTYIRWGEWAKCPYCSNLKAYYIEKGKRYKCANPECHKKFSVLTNTLMHGSKLSLQEWIILMFIYSKKIGRAYSWEIQSSIDCNVATAWYCKEKMDFAWNYVKREDQTKKELFYQLIKCMMDYGDHLHELKKTKYSTNYYHVHDIDNISDPKQYDMLVRYANARMMFCEWIFLNFASGEEVISEALLWMAENGIKQYNADSIVSIINNTLQRMWMEWVNAHPNIAQRYRDKHKEWRREWRRNIKPGYVVELLKQNKQYNDVPREELRSNKDLLKDYRERIKQRRDKLHQIYEWHSHFN